MSVASDSPVHSSSSGDDFASFLDAELDSTSDTSPEPGDEDDENENENDHDSELFSTKKQKVELLEKVVDPYGSTSRGVEKELEASIKEDICTHPGVIGGMCIRCGQKTDEGQSGVAFGYIHKDLRLANDEIARLRNNDLKNLFRHKKLNLVLDLDHTLLNSTHFRHIMPEEEYLRMPPDSLPDKSQFSTMPTDFELPVIKLVTTKHRIEGRRAKGYEYVPHEDPVKEESQFYQDFIKAVELQFGANSEELRVFEMWNKMCKEHVISIGGFTESVRFWFKDHDQLYLKFANTVLPYLYPLATEEEVHLANKFLQSVKAAFPENKKRCYEVALLIVKFQSGKLALKEMTVKMLELLENRVELIEAYFQFVPQAHNFVPRAQKVRNSAKFFAYAVVAGGLVVLGIALSKMKK